jgi:hypothetical protein
MQRSNDGKFRRNSRDCAHKLPSNRLRAPRDERLGLHYSFFIDMAQFGIVARSRRRAVSGTPYYYVVMCTKSYLLFVEFVIPD